MGMCRRWWSGCGVAVVLHASSVLAAEDPDVRFPTCGRTPTTADVEAAKVAHKAASQLFERGEYSRAIENWRDTYKLDCTAHAVLINVASAYEKMGDADSAIASLEAYLKRSPDAPDKTTIEQKIENLKKNRPPPPPPPPVVPTAPKVVPTAPKPPPRLERPFGAAPWVAVGTGGAVAIAGAVLLPLGVGAISSAEATCPPPSRACPKDRMDAANEGNTGRTLVLVGDIALGLGGAALVGGLVWQFVFNQPQVPQAHVHVAPSVGPGFQGLAVTGSF